MVGLFIVKPFEYFQGFFIFMVLVILNAKALQITLIVLLLNIGTRFYLGKQFLCS